MTDLESLGITLIEDDRLPDDMIVGTGDPEALGALDRLLDDPFDAQARLDFTRLLRKRRIVVATTGDDEA